MAEAHKHILIRGEVSTVLREEHTTFLENWFREMVDLVGMNILVEPKAVWCDTPGNEGVTGAVIIDTSHMSLHQWICETPYYQFDLYSCKDYNKEVIFSKLLELGTTYLSYKIEDRSDRRGSVTIDQGEVNF